MKPTVKAVFAAVFIILMGNLAKAQILTAGVEGELTRSSVKISDIKNSTIETINGKDIKGYEAGIYFRLGVPAIPVYLKPKFLVDYQTGMTTVTYSDRSQDVSFSVARLDIPILAGLKILGPLSIEAGPVYNKLLTATKSFDGNNIELQSSGLGYRVGANLQLGIIGLNIAYGGVKNNSSTTLSSFETPDKLIFGASLRF